MPEAYKQVLEDRKLDYIVAIKRSEYGTNRRIAELLDTNETEVSRAISGSPEPRYERIRSWLDDKLHMNGGKEE